MNQWWLYIIQCRDKSFYTGITTDIERRFKEHQNNNKKASKYCIKLRPLKLIYQSLPYKSRSEASKEEHRIKKLTHKLKKRLIMMNKRY